MSNTQTPAIKRYTHRDGFDGECAGALFAEVDGNQLTMVFPDGRRMPVPNFDLCQVAGFVEIGWWIEMVDEPAVEVPDTPPASKPRRAAK